MTRPVSSKSSKSSPLQILDRRDRYCVIGAGSSGLTAAKSLREYGHEVDIIEREDEVGGNWNFGKPNSRVYASTHTISSKPFTQYPDFPMPDHFPDFPHHSQILSYLKRYAEHFGLMKIIEFSTSVEQIDTSDEGKSWDVTLLLPDKRVEVRRYKGLVIANGHNWFPKIPQYPGGFEGEVIHSADYKSPDILRGKRVLVVGAGNTGCDIAVEASQHAEATFHSTRRGYWYAPKYALGKPSDQVYDLLLSLRLPLPIMRFCLEVVARMTVGDLKRYGLPRPDHKFLETHPIINTLLVYHVGHGAIKPRPDITRFEGSRVWYSDDTFDEVDLVVYCTGYLIHFPFISKDHLNWKNGRPQFYKHIFHPTYQNLFMVGLIQPDSGQFKLVHWQSVAIARFLRTLEDTPEKAAAFQQHVLHNLDESLSGGVHYKESTRHYVEVQHMDYLRGIADIIDRIEPSSE